jgi:hypothetical protein
LELEASELLERYFDADAGQDLAVEVREYHIPDFSNWTNPALYKEAFPRVLAGLRNAPEARAVTATK